MGRWRRSAKVMAEWSSTVDAAVGVYGEQET
jgi:hypothetical protein